MGSSIRRTSDLGTQGVKNIADGAVQTADIANNAVTQQKVDSSVPLSGFRNVIINGDMRVNQRSGSYASAGYTLDRWFFGVTGAYTISQSSLTPPINFSRFMRVQRTNGSTNTAAPQICQSLETTDSIPLQGKPVTVSFWARAGSNYSPSGSLLNWRIYGGTGTDQNLFAYTGQTVIVDQSVTLTTSWQRFSFTVSSLTSYNEYGLFFFCSPTGTAGVNDFFDITGVQLEVGLQATPFEQRLIGVELALCQRYYYLHVEGNTKEVGTGFSLAANDVRLNVHLPTTMRITPTQANTGGANFFIAYYGSSSVQGNVTADPNTSSPTLGAMNFSINIPGNTPCLVRTNSASARIAFSAEL